MLSKHSKKWSRLDGASVAVPTDNLSDLKVWPSAALFRFRESKYAECTATRNLYAEYSPYTCHSCGMKVETARRLAMHMRSQICLKRVTNISNQFSTLFTQSADVSSTLAVGKQSKRRPYTWKAKSTDGKALFFRAQMKLN